MWGGWQRSVLRLDLCVSWRVRRELGCVERHARWTPGHVSGRKAHPPGSPGDNPRGCATVRGTCRACTDWSVYLGSLLSRDPPFGYRAEGLSFRASQRGSTSRGSNLGRLRRGIRGRSVPSLPGSRGGRHDRIAAAIIFVEILIAGALFVLDDDPFYPGMRGRSSPPGQPLRAAPDGAKVDADQH